MNQIDLNYTKAGLHFTLLNKKTGLIVSMKDFIEHMRENNGNNKDIQIINNIPTKVYTGNDN